MTRPVLDDKVKTERASNFEATAQEVVNFQADLDRISKPIKPDEGVELDGLYSLTNSLVRIFDSKAVKESFVQAPLVGGQTPWLNDAFFSVVSSNLQDIRTRMDTFINLSLVNFNTNQLRQQVRAALRRADVSDFDYISPQMQEQVGKIVAEISKDIELQERRGELAALESRAEAAVSKTEAAADVAARAAGKTGDDTMSSFYSKLSESEAKSADTFRQLTVAFAMTAGATAGVFLFLPQWLVAGADVAAYVPLIQKAVFVAAIFGLSGYFARQAHQHRSMANWSGSLAVQLQTFDAYLAAVDSVEVKDELRKSFAARAFGDHPAMKGEPSVSTSAATMDAAVALAAKIAGGGK